MSGQKLAGLIWIKAVIRALTHVKRTLDDGMSTTTL